MIGLELLVGVEELGVQGLGILRAQLEDVAHLDGVPQGQLGAAPRARIAVDGVAQVGEQIDLEIAVQVDARQVGVGRVGAGHGVGHVLHVAVGQDGNLLLHAHRPGETDRRAGHLLDHLGRGQFELRRPSGARRILPSLASWSPRTSTAIGWPSAT